MRGPHVRFCERRGGVILRAYSTCAWHGHWIGGESPSRGEAVWGRSPRRTAAPNGSEPLSKPGRPGQRVFERDAQNPFEAGVVVGAGAAGHPVSLPREVCVGPPRAVDPKEATTTGRR